ncbi:MAG TPA: NUDIX domain-containing protein [Bdellovibrionales bacterium]|nr:NUDIX domain-containing protein [Bdellovibrionales bacterium]
MARKPFDETWYVRPPGIPDRTSAGGIVVRIENGKPLVALIREGKIKDFVLPKGKVEKGETIEQAAAREIEEEAGISDLELIRSLGALSRLNYHKNQWVTTHYFLFVTKQSVTFATDSSRDYSTEWFNPENLPKMYWAEQRKLIEDNLRFIFKLSGGD